jgi:diguanylate cyclase (GGDEF)-like protein
VVEAVEQVSQGNYNAKIRDSVNVIPQELNVLTSSFNTMIDDMGDYENQLRYQASFDQLTNLPNRWLFIDRLEQAIGDALRQKTLVSLLFLDLDRFKVVNDTHGHEVGDAVLQQVATRLQGCIRETDTVARIGGDEFTIILARIKNTQMATVVASKIIDAMSKPFIVDERECFLGVSIGISISPTDSDDPEVLMKNGDIAMYQAKSSGRNTYRYFTDEMNRQVLRRAEIEHGLHGAIQSGEITLHYQPIIEVTTKKVASVEVLMRWKHPQLGNISPAEFISIAEENGMIKQLGEWMLLTVCQQAKAWLDEGTLNFGVSVNLSSREIPLGFSVASVENVLNETGLPAHYLTFEITENLILDDTQEIQSLLCGMKALGVSLSIDDFGTGYSSFSYLTKFPFDIMKIDRAFTQNITDQKENARLIEGMIALGKRLNLKVIAEGIETEAQFALLQQFECDYAQGFYFTPAVPASELLPFITNQAF